MIREIHRPETMTEALALLARTDPPTVPLGGGTVLSRQRRPDVDIAVIDLRGLGLDRIQQEGGMLQVGATVTLQQLLESEALPTDIAPAVKASLEIEAGANLRRMATVAGTVVSSDGRSPFITALLALDARLVWAGDQDTEGLGDYLALRHAGSTHGVPRLLVEVRIPTNASLQFESVARSPLDRPIVCAAVAHWPSGRTRVALGGYGIAPILAMDGPEPAGAAAAARDAYLHAGDAWASADYRSHVAGVLASRLSAARVEA